MRSNHPFKPILQLISKLTTKQNTDSNHQLDSQSIDCIKPSVALTKLNSFNFYKGLITLLLVILLTTVYSITIQSSSILQADVWKKQGSKLTYDALTINSLIHKVGIGTTNPQAKLHVSNGRKAAYVYIGGTNQTGRLKAAWEGNHSRIASWSRSGYKNLVIAGNNVILNSNRGTGFVGIGTNSPREKLDLNGSMIISGDLRVDGEIIAEIANQIWQKVGNEINYSDGAVNIGKELTVGGSAEVKGSAAVRGALSVDGSAVIRGSLSVDGGIALRGPLTIDSQLSVNSIIGDVTGNVTGNLTGDVVGDVTGNLTGDVVGDVTGNLTGNLSGDIIGDTNIKGNVSIDGRINSKQIKRIRNRIKDLEALPLGKDGEDGEDGFTPEPVWGAVWASDESGSSLLAFTKPDGSLGEFVDLRGKPGPQGLQGEPGMPAIAKDGRDGHTPEPVWDGTSLRFTKASGSSGLVYWGESVDLKGDKGEPGDPGIDGANGTNGIDGKLPVHLWVGTSLRFSVAQDSSNGGISWGESVDLKGVDGRDGHTPEPVWDGTSLRFTKASGSSGLVYWGESVDLKGEPGEQGIPGEPGLDGVDGRDGTNGVDGHSPEPIWDGTSLAFTNKDGSIGESVDLKGEQGNPGLDGLPGEPGRDGVDGIDGVDGQPGLNGTSCYDPSKSNECWDDIGTKLVFSDVAIDNSNPGNARLGVGTHSPSEKVEVVGTVKATKFVGDGSGLTNISSSSLKVEGSWQEMTSKRKLNVTYTNETANFLLVSATISGHHNGFLGYINDVWVEYNTMANRHFTTMPGFIMVPPGMTYKITGNPVHHHTLVSWHEFR